MTGNVEISTREDVNHHPLSYSPHNCGIYILPVSQEKLKMHAMNSSRAEVTVISLVNSLFSQDAGPPIFPTELAYAKAALSNFDVSVHDLNLGIYRELDADITSYHQLACVFGGYVFSYPHSAFLPFNEYPFEAVPAVELLLALIYGEDVLEEELCKVAARFGLPEKESLELLCRANNFVKKEAEILSGKDIVIINMPSPGSVIPGILLGYHVHSLNKRVRLIGRGNHINVPEVAQLALALGAFETIVDYSIDTLCHAIDPAISKPPSHSLLPDIIGFPHHDYPLYHGLKIIPFETSQGCPSKCNFCSERLYWNSQGEITDTYIARPLDRVVSEIEFLTQKLGIAGITFNDCLLNVKVSRTRNLFAQLAATNLLYSCSLRVDRLEDETIQALSEAHFTNAIVGLETVSQDAVKLYNKGGKNYVSSAWKAIPALYQNGILPQLNILIGHPYESLSAIKNSIQAAALFAEFLEGKGIPFHDAPAGTVCINYPSAMYFQILRDPAFSITYHQVPDALKNRVPPQVAECINKIPFMAIKQVPPEEAGVNKVEFCRAIHQLFSKDQERIVQLKVSSLTRHKELILKAWLDKNIAVRMSKSITPQEGTSSVKAVLSTIASEGQVPVKQLIQNVHPLPQDLIVPILLTFSMAGMIDFIPGSE